MVTEWPSEAPRRSAPRSKAPMKTPPPSTGQHQKGAVPAVKYSEIICALSYSGTNSSMQTNAQQNIDHDAVVFAGPDLKVLPGDTIVVKRFGRDDPSSAQEVTFEVIGRPSVYATHQEIKVKDGDLS